MAKGYKKTLRVTSVPPLKESSSRQTLLHRRLSRLMGGKSPTCRRTAGAFPGLRPAYSPRARESILIQAPVNFGSKTRKGLGSLPASRRLAAHQLAKPLSCSVVRYRRMFNSVVNVCSGDFTTETRRSHAVTER